MDVLSKVTVDMDGSAKQQHQKNTLHFVQIEILITKKGIWM